MNGEFFMSDRLPRSNSQSHLPNYGQGQPDDKNKDVAKKKDGAPSQSDKHTGQGHAEKNQAAPQMKSKEEKKVKAPSESDSDDGGVVYGANFENILFGEKQGDVVQNNTFQRMFLKAKPSQAALDFKKEEESSSVDGAARSESKTLKSPRQQQSEPKEKTANNKVPRLPLHNLGNAPANPSSDRPEITVSPRQTPKDKKDSNTSAKEWIAITSTHPTPRGTTTSTTTSATTPNITQSTPRVEKNSISTPRSFLNLLTGKKKTKNTSEEKTSDSKPETKVSGTKATESVKKTTYTPAAMASVLTKGAREAIDCALSGKTPTGDQLAELVICTNSQGYTKPIIDGEVKTILRGALVIGDFEVKNNGGTEKININIVELVQKALIESHLDTGKLQRVINKIVLMYKEVAPNLPPEIERIPPKDLRKNEIFVKLMKPLTDLFLYEIFGEEMKLSKSSFSKEYRNFLSSIDAGVVRWANAIGNVNPDLLFRLRKSAIAAYLNTRGIQPTVNATLKGLPLEVLTSPRSGNNNFDEEKFESEKLGILNRYLATVINQEIELFYFDIMGHTENQGKEQEEKLRAFGKAYAISENAISPRKPEKRLEKESENQKNNRYVIRSKEVSLFVKTSEIKSIDSNFFRYLREELSKEPRLNYVKFKESKAEYILGVLDRYIKKNSEKLKKEVNFVQPLRTELEMLVAQEKKARMEKEKVNPVSIAQTTSPVTRQIQTEQVIGSTVVSATQTLNAEDVAEPGSDDLSESSENAVQEESAKSPSDDSVAEPPTAEEATPNVLGDLSAAFEKINQQGLRDSPFDDSESSSSQ
jgi:hypothetical protein